MSKYFPPYNNSSENMKVELDLSNYAAKKDIKDITHIDASGFSSKTEVDKIDIDKLKTVPDDLAKLTNIVKNEVVKKTDFSADDYVKKTKFSGDINSLDDKIDKVEKKISDKSDLAKKTSLSNYMLTTDFNTKSTDLETKINANGTEITSIKSDLSSYAKKADVKDHITKIKNDYATNASLDSKLNGLKSEHTATEVKSIDDKTNKKNASDILVFESRLKQKEDIIDDVQRDNALTGGRDYYRDMMYLLHKCSAFSFNYTSSKINQWKSTGLHNFSSDSHIDAVAVSNNDLPSLVHNGRLSVKFDGCYFKQTILVKPNDNKVINVYIVYKLHPISRFRSDM